jgi:hypothetical protein
MTIGAARVWLTCDELAELLQLPAGHRIHAVDELPVGHLPGVALTIVAEAESPPFLPQFQFSDPLNNVNLATYRKWISPEGVTRQALRAVEEPMWSAPNACADDCTHPSHRHGDRQGRPGKRADIGYTPAATPAMQSFTPDVVKNWPTFPGQNLPITGEPVRGDPGDEDQHFGGPR